MVVNLSLELVIFRVGERGGLHTFGGTMATLGIYERMSRFLDGLCKGGLYFHNFMVHVVCQWFKFGWVKWLVND